jgi:hypothetical protein
MPLTGLPREGLPVMGLVSDSMAFFYSIGDDEIIGA